MDIRQDFLTFPDVDDEEYKLAVSKVHEEFYVLTAGKPKLNLEEAIELREYIRKRTDLEKPDEKLAPEQKIWKWLFYVWQEELNKNFGKNEIEKLDGLKSQMDQLDLMSQNVDELFHMGRQIEELLLYQRTYFDLYFEDGNKYRENEQRMVAEMLAESTPNSKRIEIAREILQLVNTYKRVMVKPLFEHQDKIYDLLSMFSVIYKQMPFALGNEDERIKKIETLYGDWLALTEELHKERLKKITAIRNLVELDKIIPSHIIQNNGDTKVNISGVELAEKAAPADVLFRDGHSKEIEIDKKRTTLSIEAFGPPDSYINIKQEKSTTEPSKGNLAEADLAVRLESLLKGTGGVAVDRFLVLLEKTPEKMTVAELDHIIEFASNQVGIWGAEYSFSPVTSPNIAARAESELWAKLWETWSDILLKLVPDLAETVPRRHRLIVAQHNVGKSFHYTGNKPVRRIIAATSSKVAIVLGRLGIGDVAERLYAFSLYPKGSVGRGNG